MFRQLYTYTSVCVLQKLFTIKASLVCKCRGQKKKRNHTSPTHSHEISEMTWQSWIIRVVFTRRHGDIPPNDLLCSFCGFQRYAIIIVTLLPSNQGEKEIIGRWFLHPHRRWQQIRTNFIGSRTTLFVYIFIHSDNLLFSNRTYLQTGVQNTLTSLMKNTTVDKNTCVQRLRCVCVCVLAARVNMYINMYVRMSD